MLDRSYQQGYRLQPSAGDSSHRYGVMRERGVELLQHVRDAMLQRIRELATPHAANGFPKSLTAVLRMSCAKVIVS